MRPIMSSRLSAVVALLLVTVAESFQPELCVMMDGKCSLNIRGMLYNNQSQIAQCVNAQIMQSTPAGPQLTCAPDAPDFCAHVYTSSATQTSSFADGTVTQTTNTIGCFPRGYDFMGSPMHHMGGSCSLNISISTSKGVVDQFEKDLNAMPASCKDIWNNITIGVGTLRNCATYVDQVSAICEAANDCAAASTHARSLPLNCAASTATNTTNTGISSTTNTGSSSPETAANNATSPPGSSPNATTINGAGSARMSALLVALAAWLML